MYQQAIKRKALEGHSRLERQKGFSLIEVLVAFLILAIGLLGVAALQITGAQYNHDAYLRSQFSILMYDMVDRIRLNKVNAASYVTTLSTTGTPSCIAGTASVANDLACWQAQFIAVAPPGSTATIGNPSGDNEYTMTVTWTDRENNNKVLSYRFEP